jgi:6-phosphofructokinase
MGKRIAILTGGGHVAALNSGIASIVEHARGKGWTVIGALDGWKGMQDGRFAKLNLSKEQIAEVASTCGTVIKASRTKPDLDRVATNVRRFGIDAVIAMGGDDTLGLASAVHETYGIPMVGWPKTMDNDLSKTYFSLGYPSAVRCAAQCVRESYVGSYAHNRLAIVTMFGRNTDWVVAGAGGYGYADLVIPAEHEYAIDDVYRRMDEVYDRNQGHAVIAVAEGAHLRGLESHVRGEDLDEFGHYKLDPHLLLTYLGRTIKRLSTKHRGREIKTTLISLTYQLRNGPPADIDRRLAVEAGAYCVEMVAEARWGEMATVTREGDRIAVENSVPLQDAVVTRPVKGTGYFDYDTLQVTDAYFRYARPFLGERGHRPGCSFSLDMLEEP